MRAILALMVPALFVCLLPVHGQERKPAGPAVYKVEFNFHEGSDAAAKAGRRYTLLVDDDRKATFRIGSRVPVASGSFMPSGGGSPLVNTQYQYLDVGVNIECLVADVNGRLALHGNLDLSSVVKHDPAPGGTNPPNPTVGQTRLELDTMLEPGKPTIVASIDDPVDSRKLQVEATVTKIN
jgi:general secretion pathway protein D